MCRIIDWVGVERVSMDIFPISLISVRLLLEEMGILYHHTWYIVWLSDGSEVLDIPTEVSPRGEGCAPKYKNTGWSKSGYGSGVRKIKVIRSNYWYASNITTMVSGPCMNFVQILISWLCYLPSRNIILTPPGSKINTRKRGVASNILWFQWETYFRRAHFA